MQAKQGLGRGEKSKKETRDKRDAAKRSRCFSGVVSVPTDWAELSITCDSCCPRPQIALRLSLSAQLQRLDDGLSCWIPVIVASFFRWNLKCSPQAQEPQSRPELKLGLRPPSLVL